MFRPSRALLHPVFVLALVVLALNDHLFKGSGVWPSVTGKASDFAGLLVAQGVLAVGIRIRSRRAFTGLSIVLGCAFVAIKTSGAASAFYEHALSFVHATNVVAPTDLVALVVLPLGLRIFTPAMQSSDRPTDVRRTVERLALVAALPFCLATCSAPTTTVVCVGGSVEGTPTRHYGPPDAKRCLTAFNAWTFVYNSGEREVDVTVRVMREPSASNEELDQRLCEHRSDNFLPLRTIHLRRGEAAPIDDDPTPKSRRVALVDLGDGYPKAVFVAHEFSDKTMPRVSTSGWTVDGSGTTNLNPSGIGVHRDADDGHVYDAYGSLVYAFGCALDLPDASTIDDPSDASTIGDPPDDLDAEADEAGVDP